MTLQNGLLTEDAAYLWSDTGMYSWDERQLLWHEDKIFVGAGWPWAYIHSGTDDVAAQVDDAICVLQPANLDALVRCIQSALEPHLGHDWPGGQRVLIAAYEGGPRLLIIGTGEIAGYRPLVPVPIYGRFLGTDSEAIRREADQGVTPDSMVRVIRAQHAESHLDGHWPLAGKVTRARVSAEGVELTVVDDLPDPMAV